jgi:adenylate cyclase
MPEHQGRRLAAILFTDIVGYSTLMAAEEERGLRVRARHRELVLPAVERHRGEPVEMRGDECLIIFPSALDAVHCALDILDALEHETELDLHVGIHVGDVVALGDEISGDGVNVARRLCALSPDGGLCVSSEVRQSVRNQPDVEARSLGLRELKGVGRPVEVFALGRPGRVRPVSLKRQGSGAGRRPALVAGALALALLAVLGLWLSGRDAAVQRRPISSVAVLPLENLNGDPAQEYFADGMTEALITSLARVGSLRVTSRTTVLQYKNTDKPLPEIARELGVDALIEGSILREGDRVRITTQLIDARSDEHLWAEQFDRELRDVLRLQSEVARGVARQVVARQADGRLTPREEEKLAERGPIVPEAHEAYLKGVYFANKHTPPAALRAREHFERAMLLDPESPLGYAGLADTLSCSPMHTWVIAAEGDEALPREVMKLARKLAERAIDLDADLPEAQTALGLVRLYGGWDWDGALDAIDTALEINPSYEFALRARAHALAYRRRFDEARESVELALAVDPLNAQVTHLAGQVYEWSGDPERAAELYQESTALDAVNPNGLHALGLLRCRTGAVDEGVALLERAREVSHDDPLIVGDLGWCQASAGREREARSLLAELEARRGGEWVSPVALARIHIALGERERALAELERAYDENAYEIVALRVDARWETLRGEPRFEALVRRIGLLV